MRKILIGLAILGVGTVIILSAQKGLRQHAGAAPEVGAVTAEAAGAAGEVGERQGAAGAEGGVNAAAGNGGATAVADSSKLGSAKGLQRTDRGPTHPAEPPTPVTATPDRQLGASIRESERGPDIAEVLRRAAGVYTGVRSLQADFSQRSRNPILRTTVASEGTLYQRRPDRFLMRFSDPAGDLIVSDGSHIWVYYPSVDAKQVLRMPASMGAGGVDLQAQFVGDPLERFAAAFEGREEVAGRSAYVLLLTPRQPIGYRSLKVWIDAGDYLVRRFEVTEESGIVRYFELSNLRLDPKLADDLFRFTPPEGTHVVDRG